MIKKKERSYEGLTGTLVRRVTEKHKWEMFSRETRELDETSFDLIHHKNLESEWLM